MNDHADELPVTIERLDDVVIVRPEGEIDLARSPELRHQIALVQDMKVAKVIIDLARVPYMDSSGVATLVEAMQVARKVSHTLVLCGLCERVRSIFDIARLGMVFTIVDDVETALAP